MKGTGCLDRATPHPRNAALPPFALPVFFRRKRKKPKLFTRRAVFCLNFLTAAAVQGNEIHSAPLTGDIPGCIPNWKYKGNTGKEFSGARGDPAIPVTPSPGRCTAGPAEPTAASPAPQPSPPPGTEPTRDSPSCRRGEATSPTPRDPQGWLLGARTLGPANTVNRSPREQKRRKFPAKCLTFTWQHHRFREDSRKRFAEQRCARRASLRYRTSRKESNSQGKRFLSATTLGAKHLTARIHPSTQPLTQQNAVLPQQLPRWAPARVPAARHGGEQGTGDARGKHRAEPTPVIARCCNDRTPTMPWGHLRGIKSSPLCHRNTVYRVGTGYERWCPAEHRRAHRTDESARPGRFDPALTKGVFQRSKTTEESISLQQRINKD